MSHIPLEYDCYYHLYNRGINGCSLFKEYTNYEHFLTLYDKYISPIAKTYAWVLMGNHFHFLVRIKNEDEILTYLKHTGFENQDGLKRISQQFSNLFNAYTKAFNKRYKRTGSLFEHPFRRIKIEYTSHLKYLVYYIHHNPVHHQFCNDMLEYPWSSYLSILSPKQTKLSRNGVLKWYNQADNFKQYHSQKSIETFSELHIDFPFF